MQRRLLLLLSLAALAPAAEDPRERELFARVLEHMRLNLARLPDYTCVQSIDRSRRSSQTAGFELVDRLRLEIAMVNGKEMFAWPGAGNFEDKDVDDMMFDGAFGNGNFGLLARAVFLTDAVRFTPVGERILDGRRTFRWDFRISRLLGVYAISNKKRKGVAGLRGSFWADVDSLDVVRLEVTAEEIPPQVEIVAASHSIDYTRVPIGGTEFLLPKTAELRITDYARESRNITTLSACRQYLGESKLSFSDPTEETAGETKAQEVVELPPNVYLQLRLKTELRTDSAAIGDPVTAELLNDVKFNGSVLVRRKAEVRGRVVSLRLQRGAMKYHVVGLGFEEFVSGAQRGRFRARLMDVQSTGNAVSTSPLSLRPFGGGRIGWIQHEQIVAPGILFSIPGPRLVPAGLMMVWRTRALQPGDPE
jgi:hypothetical protein